MSSAINIENPPLVDRPRLSPIDRYLCLLLSLLTLTLYFVTRNYSFVQYDDQGYVSENVHILHGLSFDSIKYAITAVVLTNWHPLTMLTWLFVGSIFGPTARVFHLTSALVHAANVALLYLFVKRCTSRRWPAFFVAALWGLHPLRVESVAWISELKDVLCGLFYLLALLAYLRYAERRTLKGYALVALMTVLALLSKPMAATLPGVLLLLDYWPVKSDAVRNLRWWGLRILEKIPLVILGCADISVTVFTQRNYVGPLSVKFPLPARIENAALAIAYYLRDMFLPRHLGVFYVHPLMVGHSMPVVQVAFAAALLAIVTGIVVWKRASSPYLLVGWLWFLGTLVPVLGLVRAGDQQRADRYTYIPSIGITLALVMLICEVAPRRTFRRIAATLAGFAAVIALMITTSHSIRRWQSTVTLFTSLGRDQPGNYLALSYRSDELQLAKRSAEAVEVAQQAVQSAPGASWPRMILAGGLLQAGRLDEAVEQARYGLTLSPGSPFYWDMLGRIREAQAKTALAAGRSAEEVVYRKEAINAFYMAVSISPDDPEMLEHLAFQLVQLPGNLDKAISVWEQAVKLSPEYAQAQGDLADGYLLKGDLPRAIEHFRAAIADGSKNTGWETKLAWLVATSPQATPADVVPMVDLAKDACDQTRNQEASALDAYAACLARVARYDDAVMAAQQAVAQANAAHQPAVAAGIARRLALYQNQQVYVAQAPPASQPATQAIIGPTTAP
jgi:tetratricopeptide (TPR) repeat protein